MSTATGYAVYDKTLGRFVTGVHKTAKAAEDAAPTAAEGSDRETRKV